MGSQVFLSFASADMLLCDAIYTYLTERHLNCWRFVERNRVGDTWHDRILSAMSSSSAFIALISPQYLASEVCLMEFSQALKLKLPIFPMQCPGLVLETVPGEWRTLVFQELRADYDIPSLEKLHRALKDQGISAQKPTTKLRVYRPHKTIGSTNDFSVICDANKLCTLRNGATYEQEIEVGEHLLRVEYSIYYPAAHSRDSGGTVEGRSPDLKVYFEGRKSYFFEAGYVGGWAGFSLFGPSKLYFKER